MLWRNLSALRRRRLLNLQAHAEVAAAHGDNAYSRKALESMVNLPKTWPFPPAVIEVDAAQPPVIADKSIDTAKKSSIMGLRGNRGRSVKAPVIAGDIDDAPF